MCTACIILSWQWLQLGILLEFVHNNNNNNNNNNNKAIFISAYTVKSLCATDTNNNIQWETIWNK